MPVDIVIPVLNQLEYTRPCLESLFATVPPEVRIYVVNNGSTDGTTEYLAGLPRISVISNDRNQGCAVAWNQGVRAGSSPWVVVLNNDVLLPEGWLDGLLAAAARYSWDIVCPALREGEYNYDLASYARTYMGAMGEVVRRGETHGVCFMVNRRVFEAIGLFDENFRIGGGEDTDFFRRAAAAGFRSGSTGCSFMHHYGCVTQDYVKKEITKRCYGPEHRAYFREKWRLGWLKRFVLRRRSKARELIWRVGEQVRYGHTLREKWQGGKLRFY